VEVAALVHHPVPVPSLALVAGRRASQRRGARAGQKVVQSPALAPLGVIQEINPVRQAKGRRSRTANPGAVPDLALAPSLGTRAVHAA